MKNFGIELFRKLMAETKLSEVNDDFYKMAYW